MTDTGVFYTTKSGDMLDAIVYGHYEGDVSALKEVLRHPRNRHLMGLVQYFLVGFDSSSLL